MQGEQLQKLVEAVKDRIVGVPGITNDSLLPLETPGIEAIIFRDLKRTVAEVENITKLALFPKRKTDLPKSPQEAYEDKVKYSRLGCFPDEVALNFPRWEDLTERQKEYYPSESLYRPGTLDWDLLNKQQRDFLTTRISFVPNKAGDAERFDGKGRKYIKLYNRNIIKVHQAVIEVPNPANRSFPLTSRSYTDSELIVYKREGGIMIMPSMGIAQMLVSNGAYMADAAITYGLGVPSLPQVLKVDYTYGLDEIPEDLVLAISMKTAVNVFETVNLMNTQGLMSYSVNGFQASFGKGQYADVIDRYTQRAEQILNRYQFINLTGY